MAVGACVQGSVGFGLNVIAVPILVQIDPGLVPGPALVAALLLTILIAYRERGGLEWRGLGWAFVGRIPGSIAGAVAVAALSERGLALTLSGLVLLAVAMSSGGWKLEPTPRTLFGAGAFSGVMGTVTAIGGPPMAMVYQRRSGAQLRATLSGFFTLTALMSILLLAGVGEFGHGELTASFVLIPGLVVGFAASRWAARFLDRGFTRPAVLGLSALSAVAAIVRYL